MKRFFLTLFLILSISILSFSPETALSYDQLLYNAQEKLNQLGYKCGRPDGLIGQKTQNAVIAYQTSEGLPGSGVLDQQTLASLDLQYVTHGSGTAGNKSVIQQSGQVLDAMGGGLVDYGEANSNTFIGKSSRLAGRVYSSLGSRVAGDKQRSVTEFHGDVGHATKEFFTSESPAPNGGGTASNKSIVQQGGQVLDAMGGGLADYGEANSNTFVGKSSRLTGRVYSSAGSRVAGDKQRSVTEFRNDVGHAAREFVSDESPAPTGGTEKNTPLPNNNSKVPIPEPLVIVSISQPSTTIRSDTPTIVKSLQSHDTWERRNAAMTIHRDWINNQQVVAAVNQELVKCSYSDVIDRNDEDAVAWMCRILGDSGNIQYTDTLQILALDSPSYKIRKYAKTSLRKLERYRK